MAVYEIRYTARKVSDRHTATVSTPQAASAYLLKYCFDEEEMWREKAYSLFLDRANNVMGHLLLSVGSTDATVIDHKLVVKGAVDTLAAGVILAHNHPSGNCKPGSSDIDVTARLKAALTLFDIRLLDHIVIGAGDCFSFSEEKIFAWPKDRR